VSTKKHFARGRREAIRMPPSMQYAMLTRLKDDPRYQAMLPSHREVLSTAVMKHADRNGFWWTSVQTMANEANVSRSTAVRALAVAEEVGLVTREPYLRPPPYSNQGSSNYFLDLRLVAPESFETAESTDQDSDEQGGAPMNHLVEPDAAEEPARWFTDAPPTRWFTDAPPELGLNRIKGFSEDERDGPIELRVDQLCDATEELRAALNDLDTTQYATSSDRARTSYARGLLASTLHALERHQDDTA
jgi:hypothetical protein